MSGLMLRTTLTLISCSVGLLVSAHPHCHNDLRGVDAGADLVFCSNDYAPEGICCTEQEEGALEDRFNEAVGLTAECADYYKQVSTDKI